MPTIHVENVKRLELANLVNDVINGQEFLITQAGEPVAKLLPIITKPNRFPDLSDFRASIAPSHLSSGKMVSQMRDEEDEKFG